MARRKAEKPRSGAGATPNGGATIGHDAELWSMADALRGTMGAAEYKHVVLGLIFLKCISDAFEGRWCTTLRLRRGSCRLSGHGDRCGCTIST